MSLMRWDPFRGAFSLLNGRTRLPGTEGTSPIGLMDLALDMYETEDNVVIELSVPGMSPDDIQVRVTGNRLSVEGELKAEHKQENKTYMLQERRYGHFYRSVVLPEYAKAGDAQAEFDKGVLKLTVPKVPEAKPTTVQVKSK